jgi:Tol biopolymer transport system component
LLTFKHSSEGVSRRSRPLKICSATALALALAAIGALPGSATATFRGRNGRIAWSVFNAGGGGGGGYASLTTYNTTGRAPRQLGYCAEDEMGNVCESWQNVAYSPDGTHQLWDGQDSSGRFVITLAGADASHPTVIVSEPGTDDVEPSFAPTGRRLVYIRQPAGEGGEFGAIVTSDLAGASVRVLSATVGAADPEYTPDGRHILFVREGRFSSPGGLWSIGTDGHSLHRVLAHALAFDISPDGRHVAYVNQRGDLYAARSDGSARRRVARRPGGDPIETVRYSPTGKLLVFAGQGMGNALFTVPAAGGRTGRIVNNGDGRTDTAGLSWQPLP